MKKYRCASSFFHGRSLSTSGPRLIWDVGYTDEKAARALPVQLFRCHHTNLLFIRRGVFSSWSDYIIAVVYADLETSV